MKFHNQATRFILKPTSTNQKPRSEKGAMFAEVNLEKTEALERIFLLFLCFRKIFFYLRKRAKKQKCTNEQITVIISSNMWMSFEYQKVKHDFFG